MRWLWLAAGWVFVALAAVGVVTPLLPTVPFLLLAAACFGRGSARWAAWLEAHPRYGPLLIDWRQRGAIPRRAKVLAISMMSLSCALAWWKAPLLAAATATAVCACVAMWMLRRPE